MCSCQFFVINYYTFSPSPSCFISNTIVFFAAFLAPILVIILFNSVVFFIVVAVLIRHKQNTSLVGAKKQKDRHSTIRLMISIIGIMALYGLTWLFGALTVDDASLAFQIIFIILNSLQGFFIFLFFCVLGREGRELWLEALFCGRYKSTYLHPSTASSTGGKNGRKNSRGMLLSSAGPPSTLEKSISSDNAGGSYVINYLELSRTTKPELKKENGNAHIITVGDSDCKLETTLRPDENAAAEGQVNALALQNGDMLSPQEDRRTVQQNGHATSGHSNGRVSGIVGAVEEGKEEEMKSETSSELMAQMQQYSAEKEGNHYVETDV